MTQQSSALLPDKDAETYWELRSWEFWELNLKEPKFREPSCREPKFKKPSFREPKFRKQVLENQNSGNRNFRKPRD